MEWPLETTPVRQVYFIVSGIGYRKDFLLLFLCFLGVKGGLHIVQHLIIMWAGSQSGTWMLNYAGFSESSAQGYS